MKRTSGSAPTGLGDWKRRQHLAVVFGDVRAEATDDERHADESDPSSDDWLRAQVPPHHG